MNDGVFLVAFATLFWIILEAAVAQEAIRFLKAKEEAGTEVADEITGGMGNIFHPSIRGSVTFGAISSFV